MQNVVYDNPVDIMDDNPPEPDVVAPPGKYETGGGSSLA